MFSLFSLKEISVIVGVMLILVSVPIMAWNGVSHGILPVLIGAWLCLFGYFAMKRKEPIPLHRIIFMVLALFGLYCALRASEDGLPNNIFGRQTVTAFAFTIFAVLSASLKEINYLLVGLFWILIFGVTSYIYPERWQSILVPIVIWGTYKFVTMCDSAKNNKLPE